MPKSERQKRVAIEDENHTLPSDATNERRPDGRRRFKLVGGKWNGSDVTLYPPFDEPLILDGEEYQLDEPLNRKRSVKYVYTYRGSAEPQGDG